MFMSWFYQRMNSRKKNRRNRTFTEAKFSTGCHIYHYYIHGVNGNCKADISPTSDDFRRIDIVVRMNLREVEDDMQTLFINAAKDTFEFRATTPDRGIVEGLLRYHPFLYDKETYPEDPFVYQDCFKYQKSQARGRRDIFQCFWNGRLIPYTAISGFDWCQKKGFKLPEECYSRFSGVLFTDSKFHVSATKLKFMELEKQLKQPGTHFTRICPIQKCPRRGDIQKEFTNWLQNCHKTLDKQVEFIDYKGTVKRPEGQPKKKQQPWAVFSSIKQHGRRYNAGDIVMFQKTPSILCGTVVKFFLHGNHKGDTFATGGDVEIKCEPEGLYEEIIKVLPIAKIDKTATDEKNFRTLGKYTLTLSTVLNDNITTVYGGRELPKYKHEFTIQEGDAESFSVGELSSSLRVGEPFDIPLQMKDCYNHPTKPPPNIKPALQSTWVINHYDLKVTLPGLKDDTQTTKISLHPGNPHSLLVKSKTNPVEVENGNPVSFEIEVHDEAGNITRFPGLEVHCQVWTYADNHEGYRNSSALDLSELVTKPVKEKIVNGEPQILEARFEIPSQKQVAPVTRQLMVMPSKQISRMELFSQGEEELVLKNNEKIKWQAGGVLEKLFYKLYDEAGREVPITAEIASNIKVTWGTDVDQRNLVNGRLPDLQIPTHVDEEHLYQVSYQEKKVSFCFKIVPCPDEPAGLKVTLPQSIVKLGETLSGDISNSCIVAIGVRFPSGSPGSRVICFSYKDYTENVVLEVAAGVPSQLKLVSEPNQVRYKGKKIANSFLFLCDDWGNPSPDENINVEIKPSPVTLTVSLKRWYYALEFKGSLKGKSIPGPSVNLTLLPDPNKPVRLSVDYEKNGKFCAGGKFPGSYFIKITFVFYYREEEIPTRVGEYTVEFSLQTNKKEDHLWSQISVNVVANEPVKLEPDCQQQTPVVFYCTEMANRILVENMTLKITDQFGNLAGQNLNGTVSISIKCPEEERSRILPLFDGKTKTISVKLIEGSALINSLAIMENSPGENGSRYILHFKPEVTNAPTSLNLFELPFHFYNDTENQQKKVELMKKKDELTESVKECDKLFDKIRNEKDLLKSKTSVCDICSLLFLCVGYMLSSVALCLEQKTSELETIEKTPRRIFSIHRNFSGPDILEMVGELAFVADDDIARVISWQLQGDMDCIITTTTEAAQKHYEDTQGNQQVMALDSMFVYQEDRPLPHISNRQELFKPSGNPTFARKHLIYPSLLFSLPVFKNLLGDTILMDDLISATNYRKANRIQCPTILTRTGERVSAKGKFGGSQNRAPPIDRLKNVFGAPLPDNYEELKEQIDVLHRYCAAVEEIEKAEKDHNDHSTKWFSEILQKEKEKDAMTKELEKINKQLGMFSICFIFLIFELI
uniref:Structural maintenance of chromosomes flexible hinge domain containing 1 n=1 Tax=Poecilia latipinna TaxID=48699 RepID=A0A3B3VGT4_9TELE